MNKTQAIPPPVSDLTPAVYLNRLVKLKKALHGLDNNHWITICDNSLQVQLYQGIGELAFAAGQTLELTRRDSPDFPLELHFDYDGVRFCQLKSALAVDGLVLADYCQRPLHDKKTQSN